MFTGILLTAICIKEEKFPFIYDTWKTYAELVVAAAINVISGNLFVIANQNANPATVGIFSIVGVFYMFCADIIWFEFNLNLLQIIGVLICVVCPISVIVHKMNYPEKK